VTHTSTAQSKENATRSPKTHPTVYSLSLHLLRVPITILQAHTPMPHVQMRHGGNYVYHMLNLLTPNVNYSGRTAPLTSKVAFYIFIQQI